MIHATCKSMRGYSGEQLAKRQCLALQVSRYCVLAL